MDELADLMMWILDLDGGPISTRYGETKKHTAGREGNRLAIEATVGKSNGYM